MTVAEFYKECDCKSVLKILSSKTGGVFTAHYKSEKHEKTVGKREILSVWAELQITDGGKVVYQGYPVYKNLRLKGVS